MSTKPGKYFTAPYRANIKVTFAGAPHVFEGSVFNRGNGNHAVFEWPAQPATPQTHELAEFGTCTKWVTTGGKCTRGPFTDPDPKFVSMVSLQGYMLIRNSGERNVYQSEDGIQSTFKVDTGGRETIESIVFPGAKIEFSGVHPGEQDAALFCKPC